MTDAAETGPRKPRVFKLDDPGLTETAAPPDPAPDLGAEPASQAAPPPMRVPRGLDLERGIAWGSILFTAIVAATALALTLWFYRLVSVGLWRDDWVGDVMRILVAVIGLAGGMLLLREITGFFRLARLGRLRAEIARAMADKDRAAETAAVDRIVGLYGQRPELAWSIARLAEHRRDVHDAGALLTLADRDLLAEIDGAARRFITNSARRVATVTALSPMALLSVSFVAYENLRLLRRLAALYGGRPGFIGTLRLARRVFVHLIATGGVALTDDLLGQFIGQDLLRRLSARLGEGVFNGALTARVGVAGIEVIRPLPFIEARPVRVRDIVAELLKRTDAAMTAGDTPKS
jgi:putative membrane protein